MNPKAERRSCPHATFLWGFGRLNTPNTGLQSITIYCTNCPFIWNDTTLYSKLKLHDIYLQLLGSVRATAVKLDLVGKGSPMRTGWLANRYLVRPCEPDGWWFDTNLGSVRATWRLNPNLFRFPSVFKAPSELVGCSFFVARLDLNRMHCIPLGCFSLFTFRIMLVCWQLLAAIV